MFVNSGIFLFNSMYFPLRKKMYKFVWNTFASLNRSAKAFFGEF